MAIHSISTVEELIEQIEQLQKENQSLLEENDELYADNRGLKEELEHSKQEYDELDSRLGDMEDLKTEIADELETLQNKYYNDMDVAHSGALSVIEDFQTLLDFIEEHHEEVYFTIRMNPETTTNYNVDEYDHARSWDKRIAFGYKVIEGK